ncbi:hypothetical protein PISL3812_00438 [Talaromyces islandicus]|uniref:GST N-terminal domain-containing protein n=1 Tax=Talaromyces islandicus TaxID=28573 RepID=A0A0U1LL89_TALIS|nr:hypothetical protein PISL3812_00438 [Talaromyces islandicus]
MAANTEPEIVLYDLASINNVCFSPVVWRIRLMLNYKNIPYRTVFVEFPDIEPTIKGLGIGESAAGSKHKYTVPAIQHVPTDTYLMESASIAEFLESTYPNPPVPLTSELGREIESQARAVVGTTFAISIIPREVNILSPRAQEYFRRTREALLGHRLEDMLDTAKEDQSWDALADEISAVGELMRTNNADGPFVLGAQPSYTDFFIAGSLQSSRMVDEDVFQRIFKYPGFRDIYEACVPYMERKD